MSRARRKGTPKSWLAAVPKFVRQIVCAECGRQQGILALLAKNHGFAFDCGCEVIIPEPKGQPKP